MSSRMSFFARNVMETLDVVFSAARVTGATESGRMPRVRDLERLGIDAAAFAAIHRA